MASKLIEDYPDNWVEQLRDRVGKVQWERKAKDPCYDGRYWEGLAMTGDRINNTSSGIRETAEFIMNSGVRSDAQRQQLEKTLEERSTNQ